MKINFFDGWIEQHFSEHVGLIHKYGERLLYLAMIIGIASLVYLVLIPANMFAHTENTILDTLIRERATGENIRSVRIPASEDIIFLSMDNETLAYGRNNPEIGIVEKRVLPRRYVAKIIDYLREEGAKAIVFDVEFKGSQGEENDGPLAEAMSKVPKDKLFLALRTDAQLIKNLDSLKEQSPQNNRFLLNHLVYPQVVLPYERVSQVLNKIVRLSGQPFYSVVSPVFMFVAFEPVPRFYPYPTSRLVPARTSVFPYPETFRLQALPHVYRPLSEKAQVYKKRRKEKKILGGTDLFAFITKYYYQKQVCLKENYQKQYQSTTAYLELLKANRLDVRFPVRLDPWTESTYSYCWADTIEKALHSSGFHIGVTSVEYDDDQFDRKTPLLYKIYDDVSYTYLGVRAALSLLNPEKIILTPDYFQVDERKIPMVKPPSSIINWRSADNLVENLNLRGNLEHYYKAQLLFPYARLNTILPKGFQIQLLPYAEYAFLPRTKESFYEPERLLNLWTQLNTPWENTGETARNAKVAFFSPYRNFYRNIYEQKALWPIHPTELSRPQKRTAHELSGHLYRRVSISQVLQQIGIKGQKAIDQERHQLEQTGVGSKIWRIRGNPISGEFSFKDKIVIYGDALADIHRTPMGVIYGPEVVATVTDMILHDTMFIQFTPLPVTILIVLVFSLMASFFPLTFDDLPIALGASVFIAIAYCTSSLAVFMFLGYYTPFILPVLCMTVALVGSTLWRYVVLDKESRDLTQAFGRYVSPQLMDEIQSNPGGAMENLKGSKKELTVLFSDLKGFTSTFENEDPETMVEQLNEYFDVMTNIILANKGTYDKYMGDAIMAFFGAPAEFEDHAFYAAKSAVEMCDALIDLNKKWVKEGKSELGLGVGLSTGLMFVGNFGSERVKNFTVMGSAVNLGARLEAYTRQAGMDIVISKETMAQCGNLVVVNNLGLIEVKGFSKPVEVYGLVDLSEEAKMAYYEGYSDFYSSEY